MLCRCVTTLRTWSPPDGSDASAKEVAWNLVEIEKEGILLSVTSRWWVQPPVNRQSPIRNSSNTKY